MLLHPTQAKVLDAFVNYLNKIQKKTEFNQKNVKKILGSIYQSFPWLFIKKNKVLGNSSLDHLQYIYDKNDILRCIQNLSAIDLPLAMTALIVINKHIDIDYDGKDKIVNFEDLSWLNNWLKTCAYFEDGFLFQIHRQKTVNLEGMSALDVFRFLHQPKPTTNGSSTSELLYPDVSMSLNLENPDENLLKNESGKNTFLIQCDNFWLVLDRPNPEGQWTLYVPNDFKSEKIKEKLKNINVEKVNFTSNQNINGSDYYALSSSMTVPNHVQWNAIALGRVLPWLKSSRETKLENYRENVPLSLFAQSIISQSLKLVAPMRILMRNDITNHFDKPTRAKNYDFGTLNIPSSLIDIVHLAFTNAYPIKNYKSYAITYEILKSDNDLWTTTLENYISTKDENKILSRDPDDILKELEEKTLEISVDLKSLTVKAKNTEDKKTSKIKNTHQLIRAALLFYRLPLKHLSIEPQCLEEQETVKEIFDCDKHLMTVSSTKPFAQLSEEEKTKFDIPFSCVARNRFLWAIKGEKLENQDSKKLWSLLGDELIKYFKENTQNNNLDYIEKYLEDKNARKSFLYEAMSENITSEQQTAWKLAQINEMGARGLEELFKSLEINFVQKWNSLHLQTTSPALNGIFDLAHQGMQNNIKLIQLLNEKISNFGCYTQVNYIGFKQELFAPCAPLFKSLSLILPKELDESYIHEFIKLLTTLNERSKKYPSECEEITLYNLDISYNHSAILLKRIKEANLQIMIHIPGWDRQAYEERKNQEIKAEYHELQNTIREKQHKTRYTKIQGNALTSNSKDRSIHIKTDYQAPVSTEEDVLYPLNASPPSIQQQFQNQLQQGIALQVEQGVQHAKTFDIEFQQSNIMEYYSGNEQSCITRENIDQNCKELWDKIPQSIKAKSGFEEPFTLKNMFSLWVGSQHSAEKIIEKIEPAAVEKIMQNAHQFRLGISYEHLPYGFYLQRAKKSSGLILRFDPDREKRELKDLQVPEVKKDPFRIDLTKKSFTPQEYRGDFRQFAALENETTESDLYFAQTFWQLLATGIDDEKRIENAQAFFKDNVTRQFASSALQYQEVKNQSPVVPMKQDECLNWIYEKLGQKDKPQNPLLSEQQLLALGQVFNTYGMQGLSQWFDLTKQILEVFGQEYFKIFLETSSANWCDHLESQNFEALKSATVHLKTDKIAQQLWWQLVDAEYKATGYVNYHQLWGAYDAFIRLISDKKLTLNLSVFDNYLKKNPNFNSVIFLERLCSVLLKADEAIKAKEIQNDILNHLDQIDWTHNGFYYASFYKKYLYWSKELQLTDFIQSSSRREKCENYFQGWKDIIYDLTDDGDYGYGYDYDESKNINDIKNAGPKNYIDFKLEALRFACNTLNLDFKVFNQFKELLNKCTELKQQPLLIHILLCCLTVGSDTSDTLTTETVKQTVEKLVNLDQDEMKIIKKLSEHLIREYGESKGKINLSFARVPELIQELKQIEKPNELSEKLQEKLSPIQSSYIGTSCTQLESKEIEGAEKKFSAQFTGPFCNENLELFKRLLKEGLVCKRGLCVTSASEEIEKLLIVLKKIDNKPYYNELGNLLSVLIAQLNKAKEPNSKKVFLISSLTNILEILSGKSETNFFPLPVLEEILNYEFSAENSNLFLQSGNQNQLVIEYTQHHDKVWLYKKILDSQVPLKYQVNLIKYCFNLFFNLRNNSFLFGQLIDDLLSQLNLLLKADASEVWLESIFEVANQLINRPEVSREKITATLNLFCQLAHNNLNTKPRLKKLWDNTQVKLIGIFKSINEQEKLVQLFASTSQNEISNCIRMILVQALWVSVQTKKNWASDDLLALTQNCKEKLDKLPQAELELLANYYASSTQPSLEQLSELLSSEHTKENNKISSEKLIHYFETVMQGGSKRKYCLDQEDKINLERVVEKIKLKDNQYIPSDDKAKLITLFFHANVFSIEENLESLSLQGLQDKINQLSQELNKNHKEPSYNNQSVELLACLRELLLRKNGRWVNDTQMLDLIYAILHPTKNLLHQIATGEGKGTILFMRAAYLALHGYTVDIFSAKQSLSIRDHHEFAGAFDAIGIPHAYVNKTSDFRTYQNADSISQKGAVNYATPGDLFLFNANHVWSDTSKTTDASTKPKRVALIDEIDDIFNQETQFNHSHSQDETQNAAFNYDEWAYKIIYEFYLTHKNNFQKKEDGTLLVSRKNDIEKLCADLHKVFENAPKESRIYQDYIFPALDGSKGNLSKRDEHLIELLQAAQIAEGLKEGQDFCILPELKSLDKNLTINTRAAKVLIANQIHENSTYSDYVHQFLHVRLNKEAEKDGKKSNFFIEPVTSITLSSNTAYLFHFNNHRYTKTEGATATPGSEEKIKRCREFFGIDSVAKIPTHQPKQRTYLKPIFCDTKDEYIANIARISLTEEAHFDQPILIACENDNAVKDIAEEVKKVKKDDNKKEFIIDTNDQGKNESEIIELAKQVNKVTFSSRLSRGTDIKPEGKKDLLVLRTYPADSDTEKQENGRSGRQGAQGQCQDIINYQDIQNQITALSKDQKELFNKFLESETEKLNKKLKNKETVENKTKKWHWFKDDEKLREKYLNTRALVALKEAIKLNEKKYIQRKDYILAGLSSQIMRALELSSVKEPKQFKMSWQQCFQNIEKAWNARLIDQASSKSLDDEKGFKRFIEITTSIWTDFVKNNPLAENPLAELDKGIIEKDLANYDGRKSATDSKSHDASQSANAQTPLNLADAINKASAKVAESFQIKEMRKQAESFLLERKDTEEDKEAFLLAIEKFLSNQKITVLQKNSIIEALHLLPSETPLKFISQLLQLSDSHEIQNELKKLNTLMKDLILNLGQANSNNGLFNKILSLNTLEGIETNLEYFKKLWLFLQSRDEFSLTLRNFLKKQLADPNISLENLKQLFTFFDALKEKSMIPNLGQYPSDLGFKLYDHLFSIWKAEKSDNSWDDHLKLFDKISNLNGKIKILMVKFFFRSTPLPQATEFSSFIDFVSSLEIENYLTEEMLSKLYVFWQSNKENDSLKACSSLISELKKENLDTLLLPHYLNDLKNEEVIKACKLALAGLSDSDKYRIKDSKTIQTIVEKYVSKEEYRAKIPAAKSIESLTQIFRIALTAETLNVQELFNDSSENNKTTRKQIMQFLEHHLIENEDLKTKFAQGYSKLGKEIAADITPKKSRESWVEISKTAYQKLREFTAEIASIAKYPFDFNQAAGNEKNTVNHQPNAQNLNLTASQPSTVENTHNEYVKMFNEQRKKYSDSWFRSYDRQKLACRMFDRLANTVIADKDKEEKKKYSGNGSVNSSVNYYLNCLEIINQSQRQLFESDQGTRRNKKGSSCLLDITIEMFFKIATDCLQDESLCMADKAIIHEKLQEQLRMTLEQFYLRLPQKHSLKEKNLKSIKNLDEQQISKLVSKIVTQTADIPDYLRYLHEHICRLAPFITTSEASRSTATMQNR